MTLATQLILKHGNSERADSKGSDELSIGDAIQQCPFFDVFSKDLQVTIANYLELSTVVAGDKLFAKGDWGDFMGFVVAGELEVFLDEGRDRTFVAKMSPGDVFGEMAVVDDLPRSASCSATTGGRVIVLFRESMRKMIHNEPELSMLVMLQVARTLSLRLRSANALIAD
jgi:CRP/FNR family cyclic AMP-dependent transcriptional regulator